MINVKTITPLNIDKNETFLRSLYDNKLYTEQGVYKHLYREQILDDDVYVAYTTDLTGVSILAKNQFYGWEYFSTLRRAGPQNYSGFIGSFVKPEHRGKGLAKQLTRALVEEKKLTNVCAMSRLEPILKPIETLKVLYIS